MKRVSIIIVTYNSLELIGDCLESIFHYNDIGEFLDVIVVDNSSSDQQALFDYISKHYDSRQVKVFDAGGNGGYGKGNNFGIAKTESELVIVMNPDVRFVSPVLRKIIRAFDDETVGMAGVNFVDGSSPYYFKPESSTFLRMLFVHIYILKKKYDARTMYMSGSLLIFDKESFLNAGAFDENIFMYNEEPDITNRILREGKKVKWLKNIMVQHLAHGRVFNQALTEIEYRSFEYYCDKYNVDVERSYKNSMYILKLKVLVSKIIRDRFRMTLFSMKLNSLIEHMNMSANK